LDQKLISLYIDKLDEMMPYMVRRMHQEMAQAMADGITANQFFVMKMMTDRGRMTVSEVAESVNVSLSAVTSLVDRLCKVGMIQRRRSEDDRRVVWLEPTEQGRDMVNTCQASRRNILQRYLGHLEEKELEFIIAIYEKIISVMRREDQGQVNEEK